MRKRAGLARAVVLDPEIVLFDEPDSGLDPVRTSLLCELIADIHGNHGGTYIVVTHDIKVLRTIGHYVAILFQGKIVANGFTDEILASKDPFVRQFLAGEAQGPLGMD
jgi:phospholipid/cholesterol/gamma-HCH transport system ATP-binding protein